MNIHHRVRCGAFLLLALPAPASALDGRDELPVIKSGEVLRDGAFIWNVPVVQSRYEEFSTLLDVEAGFRAAGGNDVEFGLSLPYRIDEREEKEGRRFLRGGAKYQLSANGGRYIALSLQGTFDTAEAETGIGSGADNVGMALHFTDYADDRSAAFHSMLGMERSDSRVDVEDMTGGYQLVTAVRFGLGTEWQISGSRSLFLQGLTSIANADETQNHFGFQLTPGYRFLAPQGGFGLTIAIGIDVPRRGIEPETQYLITLSHTPAPRPRENGISTRLDLLERKVETLERQLTANKAGVLNVEVLNASGIPDLEKRVAAQLSNLGYRLTSIGILTGTERRKTTQILYRKGLTEQAVKLGHQLAHDQLVYEYSLPAQVDLQLILGSDLK